MKCIYMQFILNVLPESVFICNLSRMLYLEYIYMQFTCDDLNRMYFAMKNMQFICNVLTGIIPLILTLNTMEVVWH